MKRRELEKNLSPITSRLLAEKGYICLVDVFVSLGYLTGKDIESWRMRKIPYLEKCIKVNLSMPIRLSPKTSISCIILQVLSYVCAALWSIGRKRDFLSIILGSNRIGMNLSKASLIVTTVRGNCINGKLKESFTVYKSWGKGQKTVLRFSKSGQPSIEKAYAAHFIKPKNMA